MLESFVSTGVSTVESHATVESCGREYTPSESQVLEKAALIKESSPVNIGESELGKNSAGENQPAPVVKCWKKHALQISVRESCVRVRTGGVQEESKR